MKARIKATGEIAKFSTGKNLQGETILLKVGTGSIFSLNEVEPIRDIDWQQAYIQFVGQIASAIISNYEFYAQGIAKECKRSGKLKTEMVAQMSIEIADALIEGLEKGEQNDSNND